MSIDINKQIQEAMERGDFDNLPGKGKPLKLETNPFIPSETRMVNQLLKDNGFAPRWLELDKEIRRENEQAEKLLTNLKGRRERLAQLIRLHPLERPALQKTFERERARALETYRTHLMKQNQKIQRFNLIVPIQGKQQQLFNLNAAIARFHEECPSL
ncbi:DUF1992 domain-containing protein [Candidatus Poribacteria bacterium]|nr:DUF1992 domain-containing protein [Candidatus Poribacteria bacterium]